MKIPFAGAVSITNGQTLHVVFLIAVLVRLTFNLTLADVLHLAKVLVVVLPPGFLFLGSLRHLPVGDVPFALGQALGAGLIVQGLLYFSLTMTYAADWYPFAAALVSATSLAGVMHLRRSAPPTVERAPFGYIDLILYVGLFLGFGHFASVYGNLFDYRISAGLVASPLLERHSIGIANFALNYSEYPFFTMFGWPYAPLETPYRISHLPMPGFVVKAFSEWCDGDLLLSLYFVQLFVFVALVCSAGQICTLLFNRVAAVAFSVIFSLHLMPIDRDYLLYLPSLVCLMTTELFVLIAINQDAAKHKFSKLALIWIALTTTFLMLAHSQFLIVFFPSLAVYLIYLIRTEGPRTTLRVYVVLVPIWILALFIAFQQNKALYPSIFASLWDHRRAVIELGFMENVSYLYPSIIESFDSFLKSILRFDLVLVLVGALVAFRTICSIQRASYRSAQVFVISGIGVSQVFGNVFDFEAGKSSIFFLTFGLFFLLIYGAAALGTRPRLAEMLCLVLIAGFLLFPQHYRLWYSGNGSALKEEYRTMRSIAAQLPEDARLLLAMGSFMNLYIGDNDEPEPRYFNRRSQRSCEMFTGRRCLYLNTVEDNNADTSRGRLKQLILTHRLTHLVTDDLCLFEGGIAPGIFARGGWQLRTVNGKTYYEAQLGYESHFF